MGNTGGKCWWGNVGLSWTSGSPSLEHETQLAVDRALLRSMSEQFRISLHDIKLCSGGNPIPPVLRDSVEYLSKTEGLETCGIFRVSPSAIDLKKAVETANSGGKVDFGGDYHLAAALVKAFLRDLPEPILTFPNFFDIVVNFHQETDANKELLVMMILEKLPEDNYIVLKYVMELLGKIVERCETNRMTSSNLANVFGPNLVRSESNPLNNSATLHINEFIHYIIRRQADLFRLDFSKLSD